MNRNRVSLTLSAVALLLASSSSGAAQPTAREAAATAAPARSSDGQQRTTAPKGKCCRKAITQTAEMPFDCSVMLAICNAQRENGWGIPAIKCFRKPVDVRPVVLYLDGMPVDVKGECADGRFQVLSERAAREKDIEDAISLHLTKLRAGLYEWSAIGFPFREQMELDDQCDCGGSINYGCGQASGKVVRKKGVWTVNLGK